LQRRQFETYLDKVFDWSARVAALPEGRQSPAHPWSKVFDCLFLGGAIQIPNVHRLEAECTRGVLRQRIGKLSEDAMGYALQRQDPASIFALGCEVARRLKRNGVLLSDWARGRLVAAVDGLEICSSYVRCCEACMEREVEHKVDGQMRKDVQYYHRIVAVVLVSTDFPVPLGLRFQREGEDEVACALPLLQELDRQLGRRFLDVLVADALYLRSDFVAEMEKLQLEWVFTVKENQPELLAEAERLTGGPVEMTWSTAQDEFQLWHAPETYWPAADRSLRVVKTFRLQKKHRVELTPAGSAKRKKRTKEEVLEESTNYYATNLELGSISPTFIHQLGRSRWLVDTDAFQTLTTQAHLKRPSVHRTCALVVLTMIRVLAYTLSLVFYHRQVVSHARQTPPTFSEMARLLAYLFLPPRMDSS
jgi:hypothetical protein